MGAGTDTPDAPAAEDELEDELEEIGYILILEQLYTEPGDTGSGGTPPKPPEPPHRRRHNGGAGDLPQALVLAGMLLIVLGMVCALQEPARAGG
jgi:hypothetical protein